MSEYDDFIPTGPIDVKAEPVMNYILYLITNFNSGEEEITLKARDKRISKAIYVAERTKKRFLPYLKIRSIGIGSDENKDKRVSKIEIKLYKSKNDSEKIEAKSLEPGFLEEDSI